MFSTFLSKPLGVALLGLIFTTRVYGSSYVPSDITCPKGSHASFIHQSYTYLAPLCEFTNITKSFFNDVWYAGAVVTGTTGTDNVPGATRAGPFGGDTFNETLIAYASQSDSLQFSYQGKGFTYTPPTGPAVVLGRYTETNRFLSICGGKATYIDILTYTCSANQIATYDFWYTTHDAVFPPLAVTVGAPVLAGDCPP